MTQINDPRIFLPMDFHDLPCPITAPIIHHDDVVNKAWDRFKNFPDQFLFIVGRNNDSDDFVPVHVSSEKCVRPCTLKDLLVPSLASRNLGEAQCSEEDTPACRHG
jgi:hypothetical protein